MEEAIVTKAGAAASAKKIAPAGMLEPGKLTYSQWNFCKLKPVLKSPKTPAGGWVQWLSPITPIHWEAEVRGSLETRS